VNELADAMKEMYQNYLLYDNKRISEYCRNKFAPEIIANQLTEIFKEVVNNHNA